MDEERETLYQVLYPEGNSLNNLNMMIVGVGGIGCELLKVVCKLPLASVHIIDMDTIELSNLNRQFLFKQEHKGKSKALMAKETINKINPTLNIHAHHRNIRELPISFFKQFGFLILALDNIEARNYVNKIGIRLGIPLLDAGTLGYMGNVHTIIPRQTKCYCCEPKQTSKKEFPVCTIRMRPEKPIHCIVWAKMLFEVFFSGQEVENDMKDLAKLVEQNKEEQILAQLMHNEINNIKEAKVEAEKPLTADFIKKLNPLPLDLLNTNHHYPNLQNQFDRFDDKLTLEEHVCIVKRSFGYLLQEKQQNGGIQFEKDDDMIIHFISSMANLRMACFTIENQSFNQVKNMAGNIVPAIASTNSIASGLEVIQMLKRWNDSELPVKSSYIQNQHRKILPLKSEKPLDNCQVCSERAQPIIVQTSFEKYKLADLVNFLKEKLMNVEEFSINHGSKELYHSEEPNLKIMQKSIEELGEKIEMQLTLINEDKMETICRIWLINNQQMQKSVYSNQQRLYLEAEVKNGKQGHEEKKDEQESDDCVMQVGQEDDEIELIQVKKPSDFEDKVEKKIKR